MKKRLLCIILVFCTLIFVMPLTISAENIDYLSVDEAQEFVNFFYSDDSASAESVKSILTGEKNGTYEENKEIISRASKIYRVVCIEDLLIDDIPSDKEYLLGDISFVLENVRSAMFMIESYKNAEESDPGEAESIRNIFDGINGIKRILKIIGQGDLISPVIGFTDKVIEATLLIGAELQKAYAIEVINLYILGLKTSYDCKTELKTPDTVKVVFEVGVTQEQCDAICGSHYIYYKFKETLRDANISTGTSESKTYRITYCSNCPEVDDYIYITSSGMSEPNMERPGYIFEGWYWDAECTNRLNGVIALNRDLTFYANWIPQYDFTISNGEVTITEFLCHNIINGTTVTDIDIPSHINGFPVTKIGTAFKNITSITGIGIPDTVVTIGDSAFWMCTNLNSISIGAGVTQIKANAFGYCEKLSYITGGKSVENIGYGAFRNCNSLIDMTIPASVVEIADECFANCENLQSVHLGKNLKTLGSRAFDYCLKLNSISISQENPNFTSHEEVLFNKNKTALITYPMGKETTSYIIPNSVINIGEYAFNDCENLSNITLSENTETIGKYAFSNCINLTEIIIPDSVTTIENYALSYCDNLKNIKIGKNVASIGLGNVRRQGAFLYCSNLESIEVDENNQYYCSVDGNLFDKDKTTLIKFATAKPDNRYFVPKGVTTIIDHAFDEGNNLHTITIPESVMTIGSLTMDYFTNKYDVSFGMLFYEGNELEWENVSSKYKGFVLHNLKYASEMTQIRYDGEETYLLIDFEGTFKEKNLICAFYKDGRLVNTIYRDSNSVGAEMYSSAEHDQIKIFTWEDLSSGTPLKEAECISTADWN